MARRKKDREERRQLYVLLSVSVISLIDHFDRFLAEGFNRRTN